ncbi:MAG: hypothetical protein HKM05_03685 [Spirochaetales bacterium]|nr:hypothetical protein [Spirochaetales bacterium]
MQNQIHYEDDLFYLTLVIKNLREGFRLPLDREFFREKFLFDLRFLQETLLRFTDTLKQNSLLIRRAEYLHSLVKVEGDFVRLVTELLQNQLLFSEYLEDFSDELARYQAEHREIETDIRGLLKVLSQEDDGKHDVITATELDLLTRPNDSET